MLVFAVLLILFLGIASFVKVDEIVDASGAIEPTIVWPIRSRDPGLIREVLVRTGDRVVAGQPLARLDDLAQRLELRAFIADSRNLVDGRLTHIAAEPTSRSDQRGVGRVYRVVVELDSTAVATLDPRRLRRGYSVRAKIITRSTTAVPLLWGYVKEKLDGSR